MNRDTAHTLCREAEQPHKTSRWINKSNRSVFYLLGIILVAVMIMSLLDPNFLTSRNLLNTLNQQSTLGIVTMGVAVALIAGCIDLTVGNLLACTAAIAALLLQAGVNVVWSSSWHVRRASWLERSTV